MYKLMAKSYHTIRIEDDVFRLLKNEMKAEIRRVSPDLKGMPISDSYTIRRAFKLFLRT